MRPLSSHILTMIILYVTLLCVLSSSLSVFLFFSLFNPSFSVFLRSCFFSFSFPASPSFFTASVAHFFSLCLLSLAHLLSSFLFYPCRAASFPSLLLGTIWSGRCFGTIVICSSRFAPVLLPVMIWKLFKRPWRQLTFLWRNSISILSIIHSQEASR